MFLLEPCGVLGGTTKGLSKTHGPCYNCLSPRHKSTDCKSKHTAAESAEDCTILLHKHANADRPQSSDGTTVHLQKVVDRKATCVLPQMANVTANSGLHQKARTQLDSGTSVSLITAKLANTLPAEKDSKTLQSKSMGGIGHTKYIAAANLAPEWVLKYLWEFRT